MTNYQKVDLTPASDEDFVNIEQRIRDEEEGSCIRFFGRADPLGYERAKNSAQQIPDILKSVFQNIRSELGHCDNAEKISKQIIQEDIGLAAWADKSPDQLKIAEKVAQEKYSEVLASFADIIREDSPEKAEEWEARLVG